MHQEAVKGRRAALAKYQEVVSREPAMPPMGPNEPNTDTNGKQQHPVQPAGYPVSERTTQATRVPSQSGQQTSGSMALLSFKNRGQPSVGGTRMYSTERGSFAVPTHTTYQSQSPNWTGAALFPSASSSTARSSSFSSQTTLGGPASSRASSYQPLKESPLKRVLDSDTETHAHPSQAAAPATNVPSSAMPDGRETKRQRTDCVSTQGNGMDTSSFYGR
jgi:hypothetical protein